VTASTSSPVVARRRLDSGSLPSSIEADLLQPVDRPIGICYLLHGGNGGDQFLATLAPVVLQAWDSGALPPMVVATPLTGRSFYMDFRDGSQLWETMLTGPLLERLRADAGLAPDSPVVAAGVSMGGMGALRLGFKHPGTFSAIAALEPGIEPALEFEDIELRDRFYRDQEVFETIYGRPVDRDYWRQSHPAAIAAEDPGRLRNLGIYLECGDEDVFELYRGAEFLHRLLFDAGVRHEYRLVRGADHFGTTLAPRLADALGFLGRQLAQPAEDPVARSMRSQVDALRRRALAGQATPA